MKHNCFSWSISYYLYLFCLLFLCLSLFQLIDSVDGKQLPLLLVHIWLIPEQMNWIDNEISSFRKENNHMATYYHVLANKLSFCLLIKWNRLKGSYEQKLHSDVFVKHRIVFYYYPIFHSTLIFWSLQMKSSFAWGWFPLLFCWLCTSAVELMPPLDPYWLSSLYSCGWKPTRQTPLLYGTPSDPGTY